MRNQRNIADDGTESISDSTLSAHGCTIRRGMNSWVVTCGQTFVAERDLLCEAEAAATEYAESARARLKAAKAKAAEDLAQREYEAAESAAEMQGEQACEARHMGTHVIGWDSTATPINGHLADGTPYDQ